MDMKRILCTSDLTKASDVALAYALRVADRFGAQVTLLHVQVKGEGEVEAVEAMEAQIARMNGGERVRAMLLTGPFMERIEAESANGYGLIVIGTHGPRGLRQHLFGADILKLVRRLAVPSLVVQETSVVENDLARIVLPVAAHSDLEQLLAMVCRLAKAHGSEVHIYQLMRPNDSPSDELLKNKSDMMFRLKDEGIPYVEVNEPITSFSIGFAEPTIRYAERISAGCIAIMAIASDEYRYIADAEKERLLANDAHIPILCAG